MNNPSVPTTLTIDGTTYTVGADLKLLPVRGRISMTRRRALTGPAGGSGELIEFSDGSWRLIDSRGATRSKGPQPGVVERPRAATGGRRVDQQTLEAWIRGAQALADREHGAQFPTLAGPSLQLEPRGRRYAKIVSREARRSTHVWAFIDLTNGDVLKPHGWNAPAEGARGNLFDRWKGLRYLHWTGPMYQDEIRSLLARDTDDEVIETTAPAPATAPTPTSTPNTTAEAIGVERTGPRAELILAPELTVRSAAFRVYQTVGGASDGEILSLPVDETGALIPSDERDAIEARLAAGTLREIGVRREEQREVVAGRWMCACGVISSFTNTTGLVTCRDCGIRVEIADLGPNPFTTCIYCQGALPVGADRHWHNECIKGSREGGKPAKQMPDYWTWGKRR